MKKTYAMKRLLEHGPLTMAQAIEITCWTFSSVERALRSLVEQNIAERKILDGKRYHYALTETVNQ